MDDLGKEIKIKSHNCYWDEVQHGGSVGSDPVDKNLELVGE